jgi:hypothetical protein
MGLQGRRQEEAMTETEPSTFELVGQLTRARQAYAEARETWTQLQRRGRRHDATACKANVLARRYEVQRLERALAARQLELFARAES